MSEGLKVHFESGEATVDAVLVAEGLDLKPDIVPAMIRDGKITCAFERGEGADAGRFRLTFWHGRKRFRMVVDRNGNLLKRFSVDYGERAQARRAST